MEVRLDGDWERLGGAVWEGEEGGRIELTLYQAERQQLGDIIRMGVFYWLPETAYELNLTYPTTDWAEAITTLGRLDDNIEIIDELLMAALVDALGGDAARRVLAEFEDEQP